jgi:hypothetical protein
MQALFPISVVGTVVLQLAIDIFTKSVNFTEISRNRLR